MSRTEGPKDQTPDQADPIKAQEAACQPQLDRIKVLCADPGQSVHTGLWLMPSFSSPSADHDQRFVRLSFSAHPSSERYAPNHRGGIPGAAIDYLRWVAQHCQESIERIVNDTRDNPEAYPMIEALPEGTPRYEFAVKAASLTSEVSQSPTMEFFSVHLDEKDKSYYAGEHDVEHAYSVHATREAAEHGRAYCMKNFRGHRKEKYIITSRPVKFTGNAVPHDPGEPMGGRERPRTAARALCPVGHG